MCMYFSVALVGLIFAWRYLAKCAKVHKVEQRFRRVLSLCESLTIQCPDLVVPVPLPDASSLERLIMSRRTIRGHCSSVIPLPSLLAVVSVSV